MKSLKKFLIEEEKTINQVEMETIVGGAISSVDASSYFMDTDDDGKDFTSYFMDEESDASKLYTPVSSSLAK